MAQELIDFWEWVKTASFPEEEYYAIYDDEGNVTAIMSNFHDTTGLKKVTIDNDTAIAIHEGREHLHKFRVDIVTKEFKKIESISLKGLKKIDDVLHRIIDRKWTEVDHADLTVTYHRDDGKLIFALADNLKNLSWEGETVMTFFITEYNDPNVLKSVISFPVGDLNHDVREFNFSCEGVFSIYTRRIFQNYVYEEI